MRDRIRKLTFKSNMKSCARLVVRYSGTREEVEALAAAVVVAVVELREKDTKRKPCGCK